MPHTIEEHIGRLLKGEKIGPYRALIAISSVCNLRCIYCGKHLLFGHMYDKRYLKTILKLLAIPEQYHNEVIDAYFKGLDNKKNNFESELSSLLKDVRDPPLALRTTRDYLFDHGIQRNPEIIATVLRILSKYIVNWYTEELPDEKWLSIIDELYRLGAQEIMITGMVGEPLLKMNLSIKLMNKIKSMGMGGILTTNGTLLTEDIVRLMVVLKWDTIILSLDAPNEEINDTVRGQGSFNSIITALENINKEKKRALSEHPRVEINTVLTPYNIPYLEKMIDLCIEMGVSSFNLVPVRIYDPSQRDLYTKDKKMMEMVEKAWYKASVNGISTNAGAIVKYRYPLSSYSCITPDGAKMWEGPLKMLFKDYDKISYTFPTHETLQKVKCLQPWLTMVIYANGMVGPCYLPYFMNTAMNVKYHSLEDIWFSSGMNSTRKACLEGRIPEECGCACSAFYLHETKIIKESILENRGNNDILLRFLSYVSRLFK